MVVVKNSIEFTTEEGITIYLDKKSDDDNVQLMVSETDSTGERSTILIDLTIDEIEALLRSLKSMNEL